MNPAIAKPQRSPSQSLASAAGGSADAGAWPELDASVPAGSSFARRHIGPNTDDVKEMLQTLGFDSLEALVNVTVPQSIRMRAGLRIGEPRQEFELLQSLKQIAAQNRVVRSLIGIGYYDTITPTVIQRNILENPGWYTQYTPYQAEIAQGRLEALLNFQTMVSDLTALPLANASLLDEATAAAEAMNMCHAAAIDASGDAAPNSFFVADDCHPQTIAVVRTRAISLGINCVVGSVADLDLTGSQKFCGLLLQYPTTDGLIVNYAPLIERAHAAGAMVVMAADILALTLIKPPGEMGADIAIGSTQRFGVPMGFGGPHAAYMSTRTQFARKMPGRIVGVSRDAHGNPAYRLAIQTREQHIRREKATSNICTAQVLLAVMASMYGVYHGPRGLRRIALRVHRLTRLLGDRLRAIGHEVIHDSYFDTLKIRLRGAKADRVIHKALELGFNLRPLDETHVGISIDQTVSVEEINTLIGAFTLDGRGSAGSSDSFEHQDAIDRAQGSDALTRHARASAFLTHPVFNRYHSETEMLRYIRSLEARDLSLTHSMIPLGSCTMKLNATTEMIPVTWEAFGRLHPYAPADQARGYAKIFADLERWLAEITGFTAVSLQPNAGSQGEYAGLLAIRGYHESRGDKNRTVCLIPVSAHGTNPSSAVVAGFSVVPVACDARGNIEVEDLRKKAAEHASRLGALMITYPSTHGVFEEEVSEICKIVHAHGGQVYMDGANMNAQVGLCRPADIGADVCHLNLHKTFCIPHGGGGPGMGPIGVAPQLVPFLPGDPLAPDKSPVGPVSAANYGSASILLIPWVYIALMGGEGLTRATQVAILNANYMAKRLGPHYPVLFKGQGGRVAHEFVIDARQFESRTGIKVEDIAKRLMDYGFHAPTMSFPVPGTMMIEPTESESRAELDRFCDAMISIREEIRAIEQGKADKTDNVLKNAPHTAASLLADDWKHPYGRTQAAYPLPWVKNHKFWPHVGRIDNPWGDRNLVCTCPPMSEYESLPTSNDQT